WLFSADAAGDLTGYTDGFSFGAAANPVTFGRHTNSVGELSYPAQTRNTLGEPNSGPRCGRVFLNKINSPPRSGNTEFVRIRNITAEPVPLYDPAAPTNTWHLNG